MNKLKVNEMFYTPVNVEDHIEKYSKSNEKMMKVILMMGIGNYYAANDLEMPLGNGTLYKGLVKEFNNGEW